MYVYIHIYIYIYIYVYICIRNIYIRVISLQSGFVADLGNRRVEKKMNFTLTFVKTHMV